MTDLIIKLAKASTDINKVPATLFQDVNDDLINEALELCKDVKNVSCATSFLINYTFFNPLIINDFDLEEWLIDILMIYNWNATVWREVLWFVYHLLADSPEIYLDQFISFDQSFSFSKIMVGMRKDKEVHWKNTMNAILEFAELAFRKENDTRIIRYYVKIIGQLMYSRSYLKKCTYAVRSLANMDTHDYWEVYKRLPSNIIIGLMKYLLMDEVDETFVLEVQNTLLNIAYADESAAYWILAIDPDMATLMENTSIDNIWKFMMVTNIAVDQPSFINTAKTLIEGFRLENMDRKESMEYLKTLKILDTLI